MVEARQKIKTFLKLSYTVSELEVRNLKPLEMIEKPNNFGITCLYLQEYKKAFAFSTKFHYFSDQKQHILHLKKQFFFQNFFLKFPKKFFSSNLAEL